MSVGYTIMSLQFVIVCITGVIVYKWMTKGNDAYDDALDKLSKKHES